MPKKIWEQQSKTEHQSKGFPKVDKVVLDISKMVGSEEDKIQAMMQQSAADYDPKGYQKVKGQPQIGEVPGNYRCNKCKKVGHWIKNCPYTGKDHIEMKRTTGIPKSFREKEDRPSEPTIFESTNSRHVEKIPDNLICNICKDIFTDAVMIPCCGSSFCDDCVRTSLLESDDNECPDCGEKGSSPGSLIPNRFLRNSVNAFKNETGYNRPAKKTGQLTEEKILQNEQILPSNVTQDETASNPAPEKNTCEVGSTSQSIESTSADESDYEDNITVTVPSTTSSQLKTANEGNSYTKNEEKSPQSPTQVSEQKFDDHQIKLQISENSNWEAYNKIDENEVLETKNTNRIKHPVQSSITSVQSTFIKERRFPIARQQQHYHQIPLHTFTPHQSVMHGQSIGYDQMPTAHFNSYPHYAQVPYPSRIGCMSTENSEAPLPLSVNLASVYEGVAAKVGSGVIDDPLEAFNRIMREKEKYKGHQRSPIRRSSRSKEKIFRKYSPPLMKRARGPVSTYETKMSHREREKMFYRSQGPESSRNYQKSASSNDRNSRAHHQSNTGYAKRDRNENEDFFKNSSTDICPPGTSERPPPGFENSSYKKEYRRKHSHDDYVKNRNYEKYASEVLDTNKKSNHTNGKESLHIETNKKKSDVSRHYSPPIKLREHSKELDLNNKNYLTYEENEMLQKNSKHYKDIGRKQNRKDSDTNTDACPVQKGNILDDKDSKPYNQGVQNIKKIKTEMDDVTGNEKTNYDHEKKIKERKKKKKNKDERERKRQKKDGKPERVKSTQIEKDNCFIQMNEDTSEENIIKSKMKSRENSPDHRNVVLTDINNEGRAQNMNISVTITEENNKRIKENSAELFYSSAALTGISKWEREEENALLLNHQQSVELKPAGDNLGKVNSEILRRAENAVFSRHIGNKISSQHENSHVREGSSPQSKVTKRTSLRGNEESNKYKDLRSLKLNQSKGIERTNEENSSSLVKSVKSRLGIKLSSKETEPESRKLNRYRSRSSSRGLSRTPPRSRNYFCERRDRFNSEQKISLYTNSKNSRESVHKGFKNEFEREKNVVINHQSQHQRIRTPVTLKENREGDSTNEYEYSKAVQRVRKKEGTTNAVECHEPNATESKKKKKDNTMHENEKELVSPLKNCGSIEENRSNSSGSDNGMESDGMKRRKKRKNKKEKRRRKRSSSTESVQLSRKKHSKNKKKNKKKKKEQ